MFFNEEKFPHSISDLRSLPTRTVKWIYRNFGSKYFIEMKQIFFDESKNHFSSTDDFNTRTNTLSQTHSISFYLYHTHTQAQQSSLFTTMIGSRRICNFICSFPRLILSLSLYRSLHFFGTLSESLISDAK